MAIISPSLFEIMWMELLQYSESASAFWESKREFQNYLFRGWIRPDKFPPGRLFAQSREWWSFFNTITKKYNKYKINGGLYKSWYHFELYQSRAVDDCKAELELKDG